MKWDKGKLTKGIWGSFCVFGIILFCEDFYQALQHPELYPLGAEGPIAGIWHYRTQELYLLFGMILVFWFVAGFLLCLLHHKYQHLKWGIIAHCFLTLLYILIASVQVA